MDELPLNDISTAVSVDGKDDDDDDDDKMIAMMMMTTMMMMMMMMMLMMISMIRMMTNYSCVLLRSQCSD